MADSWDLRLLSDGERWSPHESQLRRLHRSISCFCRYSLLFVRLPDFDEFYLIFVAGLAYARHLTLYTLAHNPLEKINIHAKIASENVSEDYIIFL